MENNPISINEANLNASQMHDVIVANPDLVGANHDDSDNNSNNTSERNLLTDFTYFWSQFWRLFWIALPQVVVFCLYSLEETISFVFLGRNVPSHKAINAIGAVETYNAYVITTITFACQEGYSILGSTAFGAGKYRLVAYYMHRCLIICYIFVVPLISLSLIFKGPLLHFLINDPEAEAFALTYVTPAALLILLEPLIECLFDFFNIVEKTNYTYFIFSASMLMHLFDTWLFVEHFQMGVLGIAISKVISKAFTIIMCFGVIKVFKPFPRALCWPDRNSFKGLWNYMKVVGPIIVSNVFNNYLNEIRSILAIKSDSRQLSAYMLCNNMVSYLVAIGSGVVNATIILIGKKIGQGLINSTRKVMFVVQAYTFSFAILSTIIMACFRYQIMRIYTGETEIIETGAKLILVLIVWNFSMQVNSGTSAILQGLNKQTLTAFSGSSCNWGINFPLMMLFFFVLNLGVYGLFFASIISGLCSGMLNLYFLLSLDMRWIKMSIISRLNRDLRQINEGQKQEEEDEGVNLLADQEDLETISEGTSAADTELKKEERK